MGASENGGGIDLPAFGDEREFVIEGPAVGEGFAEVFGIAAFESHATGVIAEATEFFDFVGVELNVRQGGEVIDFRFDGFGLGADFLDHRGDDALDGGLAEIPEAGELEGVHGGGPPRVTPLIPFSTCKSEYTRALRGAQGLAL